MSFKKIFVPLDDSELSHRVFSQALELALIDRAQVMLFNCVTINSLGETAVPIPVDLGMNAELMNQAYQAQHLRLESRGKTRFGFAEKLLRRRSQTRIAGGI
jgi:nucleotide-binding universal stress UspA family protein